MDRLKEQAFPLALGGVIVLLLVAFVFLIWKPLQAIGTQEREVRDALVAARNIPRGEDFPTPERLEFKKEQQEREAAELEAGVAFYDQRVRLFQLYFGDAVTPPEFGTFAARFEDEVDGPQGLRTKYRETFGISSSEDAESPPPVLNEHEPLYPRDIPAAMKRFWILQEIFETCQELGLGGLQEVAFSTRERARTYGRRRRADEEEEEKPPFITDHVEVTVQMDMRFAQLRDFLVRLFESQRVPFIEAKEIKVRKTTEGVSEFAKLVHEVTVDPKDPQHREPTYEKFVQEPEVLVELKLQALEWKGPRPEEEELNE